MVEAPTSQKLAHLEYILQVGAHTSLRSIYLHPSGAPTTHGYNAILQQQQVARVPSLKPSASLTWLPITTTYYIRKDSASTYFRWEYWVWVGSEPAPRSTGLWSPWPRAIPDYPSVFLGHITMFIGWSHYPRLDGPSRLKASHKLAHLQLKSQRTNIS